LSQRYPEIRIVRVRDNRTSLL